MNIDFLLPQDFFLFVQRAARKKIARENFLDEIPYDYVIKFSYENNLRHSANDIPAPWIIFLKWTESYDSIVANSEVLE